MGDGTIGMQELCAYEQALREREHAAATIEKYLREARLFVQWLGIRALTKEEVFRWKEQLQCRGHSAATVNGKLSALNGLLRFLGKEACCARYLKVQRRLFREAGRELTREEYERLVKAAQESGEERMALVMQAICATGMRVSEVKYLTVEAVQKGQAVISLKGKVRVILLPRKLCRKLAEYAKKRGIKSGAVFCTGEGRPLSRYQIWKGMKALCQRAGVASGKVFPHNLRHLFAAAFYRATKDLVQLADILGHASLETTRIYLKSSGREHVHRLERLGLIN